jgi:hypothetical protein
MGVSISAQLWQSILINSLTHSMNANSIPAPAWMLLETLSDASLSSRVRTELSASLIPTSPSPSNSTTNTVPTYDVLKLCASPILQSLYAESLRLRVAIMGTRVTTAPSLSLSGWEFRKGDVLTYASSLGALDKTVWNQGPEGDPPPLEEFWADRFLIYPHDRNSGPLLHQAKGKTSRGGQGAKSDVRAAKDFAEESSGTSAPAPAPTGPLEPTNTEPSGSTSPASQHQQQRPQAQFSLEGLAASWIPYGGGLRLCPGCHFAKQEMLFSTAVWLGAYEIELKPGGAPRFEVDKDYFGFGAMPPKGKIAGRIRRRRGLE